MAHQLTWSHYIELLPLNDIEKIKYYINLIINFSLSKRQLREKIKSKEYERIGCKCEIANPKINTFIKNPIIIKSKDNNLELNEYAVHRLILENMDDFLKELGVGFSYIGHEVSIKIGNNYHKIEFLLFNYEHNCFIVIEIKCVKMKAEYIGQIKKYMNYVDKNIKNFHHDNTVGIIVCKKEDRYVMEYCSDDRIFTTTYEVMI